MMIRRSLLPACSLGALLVLAACDGPTASERLVAEPVEGNAQEGLPGELLPLHIGVRVSHPDGSPAAGVAVRFQAADGAGTVRATAGTTDGNGMARATWQLPAEAREPLVATAEADGAEPARFTAAWLPRERTDLLLAGTPARVRLLLHSPGLMGTSLAYPAAFTDSLAVLPLAVESYSEVVAFVDGSPPLVRTGLSWTARRDTLRLDFPRSARVPVTIWIIRRPYETSRAYMDAQLETARAIWARAGIELDVRWVDATTHPDAGLYQGNTEACGPAPSVGRDVARTNVYVTGPPVVAGGTYGGYACNAGLIYITPSLGPSLLAHEFGHTFGLGHTTNNVMDPTARSFGLTLGQIFRAHALPYSALQERYPDQAVMPPRNCFPPGTCMEVDFDM